MRSHSKSTFHIFTLFALLTSLLGSALTVTPVYAAGITVNTTADVAANDGQCTLREAITSANTNAASGGSAGECIAGSSLGTDTIAFNVGGGGAQTINLGSLLPTITSRVNIDGTTQPSYAPGTGMIRVDAGGLYTIVLELGSGSTGSTVKGMKITRGSSFGIYATSASNTFQSNYIGTDGFSALPSGVGLYLLGANNVVGGTTAGTGNLISGAWNYDVYLGANGNLVQGNIIGTDATGTTSMSTTGMGIFANGANNLIGGTAAGAGNLISGELYGILFSFGAVTNTVQGNKIGTNLVGSAAVTGSGTGIYIYNQPGNVIGGSASGAANLISGNVTDGIYIEGNPAIGTVIQGNYIGTNAAGTAVVPNGRGISLNNAMGTVVGGPSSGEGNLISGNTNEGIWIAGVNSTPNTVQGNKIGTNAAGNSALPNNIGLRVSSGNNTIGGSSAGAGNLISGNSSRGVSLDGGAWGAGNVLRGNFIGTNAAGNGAIPNSDGILIDNAPNTTIGGGSAGQGNLVSGNTNIGIQIGNSTGHVVTGNNIGTDAAGSGSLPNGAVGIYLTLGASAQVNQNLIANHSGTGDLGIYLDSSAVFAASSTNNCVVNNDAGVQNDTGSSTTFTNNWWGHTSGPSGAGSGSGDSVSTDVVFTPWLTTPPAACEILYTPPAPSGLNAASNGQTEIDLTWNDNSVTETAFSVERSPNGSTGWVEIATPAANSTSYPDTGLTCATTYYYRVRAYRSGDTQYSSYSNTANVATDACPSPPTAPSGLTATPISQTQIDLSWTDNSTDEASFRIQRSTDGSSDWAEIDSVGAGVTTYSDASLICGTNRYYRVRARNADGDSAYSNTASATTTACDTTAPTLVSSVRVNSNPTSAASVDFTVTFSESVTGVDADGSDFSLTTGGVSGATVSGVSGSGSVYTVTVSTGSGNGTIRLDVPLSATVTDLTGNPLASLPYITGNAYTVIKVYKLFLPLILR